METPPTRDSRRRRPSGALAGGLSGTLKVPKPAHATFNVAAGEGVLRPPSDPPAFRAAAAAAGGRGGPHTPSPGGGTDVADRTALVAARVTRAEHAAWQEKAAEAVSVIAQLVSFERSVIAVARIGEEAGDAR